MSLCRIEAIERRVLLAAVVPTDYEQYMIELINRARANPGAEAARISVDLNEVAAQGTAKEITDRYGIGIGVAGTGLSNCGPAIGLSANVTERASIRVNRRTPRSRWRSDRG